MAARQTSAGELRTLPGSPGNFLLNVNQLTSNRIGHHPKPGFDDRPLTYWRVEGSLLNLSAVHPVAFLKRY
jgi:hypothetical protein